MTGDRTQSKAELRLLAPRDTEALARFFCENNQPETRALFHPFPLDETSARRLAAHQGSNLYFAAWSGAKIAGFGMLRGWDEGFTVPSFGVLVDAAERGRGVGAALLEFALAEARRLGSPAVRLSVSPENAAAIALYTRFGFHPAETLPDGRMVMRCDPLADAAARLAANKMQDGRSHLPAR